MVPTLVENSNFFHELVIIISYKVRDVLILNLKSAVEMMKVINHRRKLQGMNRITYSTYNKSVEIETYYAYLPHNIL